MKIFGNCCNATDVAESAHTARPRGDSTPTRRAATPRPGLGEGSSPLPSRRPAAAEADAGTASATPARLAVSANKEAFLASRPLVPPKLTPEERQQQQQLTVEQIQRLATHYESKLGVDVRTITTGRTTAVADQLQALTMDAQRSGKPIAALLVTNMVSPAEAQAISSGMGHLDAFIATPSGRLLNLVGYPLPSSFMVDVKLASRGQLMATMDLNVFLTHSNSKSAHPQAGDTECASLGMASMKEYLKNDCEQLRDHSLVLCNGQQEGRDDRGHLLIPSPQALRYSQSGLAVKIAEAVVTSTQSEASVFHGRDKYTVKTLAGYARDGVALERPLAPPGSSRLDAAELDSFRQQWADAYREMKPKREAMKDKAELNAYLAQVQHRHHVLAGR
ncbi:hypothetical protein AACH06_28010 [Ideonella sp. DXS29W]|uniref:Avirulence protein n=1 Tax=Ideonella lacteola TaxID=2984193 RepID=A0ABU9C0Q6_9BURK